MRDRVRWIGILGASMVFCEAAFAQAFCALRDPVTAIHELYPGEVSVRSSVRAIDGEVRDQVSARLPFTLLHSELGQHTVYQIDRDGAFVGYVHPRSEKTRWGLIEIAWALDPAFRVLDYRFERCRDPARAELEAEGFRAGLRGLGAAELRTMLTADGGDLSETAPPVSERSRALASALIRSALRTIAVTEIVWGQSPEP